MNRVCNINLGFSIVHCGNKPQWYGDAGETQRNTERIDTSQRGTLISLHLQHKIFLLL
jgi:hypothetical protein